MTKKPSCVTIALGTTHPKRACISPKTP